MRVQNATEADIPAWQRLAGEVESLFGPMVDESGFLRTLSKNIERGTAFCVREGDAGSGAALLGGLLLSPHRPDYRISWLAVMTLHRKKGVGRSLVEHILRLVQPPANVTVITFSEDNKAGRPARRLYERCGFASAEAAPNGPEGGSRQVFRLRLE